MAKTGIMLLNTGTPDEPTPAAVGAYLREFLMDPRILDIPAPIRWALVHWVIVPKRSGPSSEAYAAIWTPYGSPLRTIMDQTRAGLAERLPGAEIAAAMRYGHPSIPEAVAALKARGANRILCAPLYPQYAEATTGSAMAAVRRTVPDAEFLPPFYAAPEFIAAWTAVAKPALEAFRPDHIALSFHGLPERHVRKSDPTHKHCLASPDCCDAPAHPLCYRAHCMATARALAQRLGWSEERYTVCFQSRLGRAAWLGPATAQVVPALARSGVKRLAVLCPSFVADCIETIHEIGHDARARFIEASGDAFQTVPCPNAHPAWLDGLAALLTPRI